MVSVLVQEKGKSHVSVYLCIFNMIFNQLWQQVHSCDINIEDEFWSSQWYLKKSASDKYDMNILPAWRSCVNGTGVIVGVVDSGVQDHVDLNVDRQIGFGDESASISSLQHGTRVAGVIGAKKNNLFVVGVAFESVIADIKIASTGTFETFDAEALVHNSDIIGVYSCSFANVHTGTRTHPLLKKQEDAFEKGTTLGRGGLGAVYVFATGNSGNESDPFHDSCAYDRLVTNRYVVSVAGIQNDLSKVPSGEACSAMLVAAFTAETGAEDHKIVTLDVENKSTEYFNQNSAAAPMVSGAVALALSANPGLSYRDVMHLLVLTSRGDLPEFNETYFMRNAANLSVSSYFGFGLLDIGALVEKSMVWNSVPAAKKCSVNSHLSKLINSSYYIVHVNHCGVTYLEHVEVSLKVNHQYAGQIQWVLVSPFETRSRILHGRRFDSTTYLNLTVLTVQMWGENPEGYWKLEPRNPFQKSLDIDTVELISLDVHGFTCTPPFRCLQPAIQEPVMTGPNVTDDANNNSRDVSNRCLIVTIFVVLVPTVLFAN